MGAKWGCLFAAKPSSEEYSPQAQHQGQKKVCRKKSGVSSSQQVDALVRKSGEGCKAATKASSEEKTHLRTHARSFRNTVEETDQHAAQHIGHHRGPWENGLPQCAYGIETKMCLDELDTVAKYGTDTSTQKNKQQFTHRFRFNDWKNE